MTSSDHRRAALWITLAACVLLALVPGSGLVMCLHGDGVDVGVGIGGDCPCPPGPDGTHPPCVDVHIDGVRDRLPPDVPTPEMSPCAWFDLASATLAGPLAFDDPGGGTARAGPFPSGAPPGLRRALAARRTVVLTI